jgi:RimJ/RimL family protein N-acetyltransferase
MLELEIPTAANQADYERLFLDPQVQRWLRPPPLPPIDRTEVAGMLRTDIAQWDEHGYGRWVVRDAGTGELLGRAGLSAYALDGRAEVELAWTVLPGHWGRGIATDAARAALANAREVPIAELIAFTLPTNAASLRVMEKIGMRRIGPIEHAGLAHVLYRIAT